MVKIFDYKEIIRNLRYIPITRLNPRRCSYAVYKAFIGPIGNCRKDYEPIHKGSFSKQ